MDEYIELINRLRQEAEWEAYLQPNSANETPKLLLVAADIIEKLSEKRKNGTWIKEEFGGFDCLTCSVCGMTRNYLNRFNYCPNCGAKMSPT